MLNWCKRLSLAFVVFGSAATGAELEPTPVGKASGLIDRKIFFGNPDKAAVKLSPDGKQISFIAPVNGVMNVFVGPADKPDAAKPVTKDTKRGIRQYFWAFTNQHVLYLQDEGGNENFHLYCVNLADGTAKDLTPEKNVRAMPDDPNPKFPTELLVGINDRDPRYHDFYRINLTTGERKLVAKNDEFVGFQFDNDDRVRFAQKMMPDGGMAIMQPDGKDGWKDFMTIPMEDTLTTHPVGFNKTNDVIYTVDSRGRDTGALTAIDIKSGKQTVIAQDAKCDAGTVLMHPTEHTVQGVGFNYDRNRWEFMDPAVKADFDVLRKLADGDISIASRTQDDQQWIVAFLMDDGAMRYYRYDRGTKKATFLFTNRKDLEGLPLAKMLPRVIKSRDGMNLVSYLTLPTGSDTGNKGVPTKPVPMVLLVHGGPWGRDQWGLNPLHQFYANRGYAVLSVNFRGSTGFGKQFVNAGNKEWAGKMHDDLIDAVDWAVAKKIAIADKIAIIGGSYGGYATLVGLTFTPDTFACGVDIVGPSNIVTLLNTIPPYWAPMVQTFKDRVGDHTSESGKHFLAQRSPLTFVERIRKPLLIAQGANDPRVKQSEADQIVKAMQEKKIPVTYVLFPDEGHGFQRPTNSLAFNAVTEAFLAKYLGGRYQAVGDGFTDSTITVPVGVDDVPGIKAKLSTEKAMR
jgi:dipeptidyl aminopeptidase/acylaminoacyl peptidase